MKKDISAEKKSALIRAITDGGPVLKEKKITAGFDGFIDTVGRIIKEKQDQGSPVLFNTIKEFGEYVLEKQGASLSLELEEKAVKLGGNMPIMANALGRLGINVNCIGALGYPQVHPVFNNFSPHCKIYSFADPGFSTAYEFNDGKMMMAQMGAINSAGWDKIKEVIGLDILRKLYNESDMICQLNWSEIDASTSIWKGLLKDILPASGFSKNKIAFFDLSDCSKRNDQVIKEMLALLGDFSNYAKVILSLNKNEAGIIYRIVTGKNAGNDASLLIEELFHKLGIHTLVVHSSKEAITSNGQETIAVNSFFTSSPLISTGAGDHFNAGFAAAQLLELDLESSLILANAVSGYYIRTAISGEPKDIIQFLENN